MQGQILLGQVEDVLGTPNGSSVVHFAHVWAKKYLQNLEVNTNLVSLNNNHYTIANKLQNSLRPASIQAWNKTEKLISKELKRHQINPKLIDPWQIAQDSFRIFEKTLEIYRNQDSPYHLATVIGSDLGQIRKKYTKQDPRVIGFVSMQVHHTGQILLEEIGELEQDKVRQYFKVIDDHLYMPLPRAYQAAATYNYNSPILGVVQKLLPSITEIATKICNRVIRLYPTYFSYSGYLSEPGVKVASIRDVEMFQVYLWVCVLEQSIAAIQQELFPLTVMLYPTLKVRWELVRQMIHLLTQEISNRLDKSELSLFQPYLQVLWEMFSPEIFPDSLDI